MRACVLRSTRGPTGLASAPKPGLWVYSQLGTCQASMWYHRSFWRHIQNPLICQWRMEAHGRHEILRAVVGKTWTVDQGMWGGLPHPVKVDQRCLMECFYTALLSHPLPSPPPTTITIPSPRTITTTITPYHHHPLTVTYPIWKYP